MRPVTYSIIRYRPFLETGEFANIGVLAIDLDRGRLGFRLAARRVRRISTFFHDINPAVYSNTVQMLREELKQHQSSAKGESAKALFRHLIHGRETIVTFSEPRAAVTKLGFEAFIAEVYERNVMRSFITPEYREALIAKSIRGIFKTHRIRGYKKLKIADEIVPITFDLGSTHNGLRVIKPLAFDQKSTLAIIDHGAQWQSRLEHLIRRKKLEEDKVLLAVDPAVDLAEEHAEEARDAALGGLRALGVNVVLRDDVQQIVRFALPGGTDDLIQTH